MSASDTEIVAHFVPLAVIMAEHGGELARYMKTTGSRDVVVTMPVTMDVVGRGTQSFFVAVAVTWHFDNAEPLQDAAAVDCPEGHQCLFAWVPADRAGRDDFGIYIDDIGAGETLQNGMVAEVIEQACIEAAASGGAS